MIYSLTLRIHDSTKPAPTIEQVQDYLFKREHGISVPLTALIPTKIGFIAKTDIEDHIHKIQKHENKLKAINLYATLPPQITSQRTVVIKRVDAAFTQLPTDTILTHFTDNSNNSGIRIAQVIPIPNRPHLLKIECADTTSAHNILKQGLYAQHYRFPPSQIEREHYVSLERCYKCYKINEHKTANCTATQVCSNCSQSHHHTQCPKQNVRQCVNCKDNTHHTLAYSCPYRKNIINRTLREKSQHHATYAHPLPPARTNMPARPIPLSHANIANPYFPPLPAQPPQHPAKNIPILHTPTPNYPQPIPIHRKQPATTTPHQPPTAKPPAPLNPQQQPQTSTHANRQPLQSLTLTTENREIISGMISHTIHEFMSDEIARQLREYITTDKLVKRTEEIFTQLVRENFIKTPQFNRIKKKTEARITHVLDSDSESDATPLKNTAKTRTPTRSPTPITSSTPSKTSIAHSTSSSSSSSESTHARSLSQPTSPVTASKPNTNPAKRALSLTPNTPAEDTPKKCRQSQ